MAPETIGVIAYLADHGAQMKKNTVGGYVMTCCGDEAPFVFKQSKTPLDIWKNVPHMRFNILILNIPLSPLPLEVLTRDNIVHQDLICRWVRLPDRCTTGTKNTILP
jgi:hypothetical protein